MLTSDRFADKSPEQVWAILLDEGTYLCSTSTMYRILRSRDQVRNRRDQASHPPRTVPELHATSPDQCWSWDITKLRGPAKGIWYCAYVVIDIFSRKIIHAEVHSFERELLARDFITAAITANRGVAPDYVHSDNGSPMIGKTVTQLLVRPAHHRLAVPPARVQRQPRQRGVEQDPEVRTGVPRRLRLADRRRHLPGPTLECPVFSGEGPLIGFAREMEDENHD